MRNAIKCAALFFIVSCRIATAQDKLYYNEFALPDVQLLNGPFRQARDLNIETILKYDVDRLLAPYRKQSGLPAKAKSYPNWDGLDGHVAGHYLSALAMNYASTGNAACKKRMEYMLAELKDCQKANSLNNPEWGIGYAGGFPESKKLWTGFKAGDFKWYNAAWAPLYNLHKMYAGLKDAWLYCSDETAKKIFLSFCDWGIDITAALSDAQMQQMLNMEHGGMDEVFADAYQITGDTKYLKAARRFSHRSVLEPLSKGIDNLDNLHANTQIPKFIGFGRIAAVSNDDTFGKAASFFWETVTANRTLAFGGNSRREHFPAKDATTDYINDIDGPETCNSYNMLKLTEELFRASPAAKYADYYERTLFNHILSTQHPEHGGYVYFTPARPRHYRVYSAPGEAMWCCVGTGMENHSKYNQFIYTRAHDSLFVNLFIASSLQWKDKKVTIQQQTNFPFEEQTRLTVTEGAAAFNLMVRYPGWVSKGALTITINGKTLAQTALPSSYISIQRKWKKGDVVIIGLPMHNSIEQLPNMPQYLAFMHGPVLLGAKTGTENMKGLIADDSRFGQYAGGERLPIDEAPVLIDDNLQQMADRLQPVPGAPLHFKLQVKTMHSTPFQLEPFYAIHDTRYMMYWLSLTNAGYQAYTDSLVTIEKAKRVIEQRTIDNIRPGEQQPETDHKIEKENSGTGNTQNILYRDARNGGFFSYEMSTRSVTNASLLVRYWGAEWGSRKFEIYIDDIKLVTEDNTGRWNQSQFKDITYPIPEAILKGRNNLRVKFQAMPGSAVSPVYNIRLLAQ